MSTRGTREANSSLRSVIGGARGPVGSGEDYGGFDLAGGDGPIFFEEAFFFGGRDDAEAVAFIEMDGPGGVGPGADQDGSGGELL